MEALIPIVLFLSIAAVVILRPISGRLGLLLEAMARERRPQQIDEAEIARLRGQIEHVGRRMELIEERLDFTERLLAGGRPAPNSATRAGSGALSAVHEEAEKIAKP